MHGQENIR